MFWSVAERLEFFGAMLEHDPEKWIPGFFVTNAKRLRGEHARTI